MKATADKPWLARKDWARGEVLSDDRKTLIVLWIITLFWNAVSSPLLFVAEKELKRNIKFWFALIFPAIGLLFLIAAIRTSLKYRKFGRSVFKLMSVPGEVGGSLAGVISTNTKLIPKDGFHLDLRCLQRVTRGSGKNRRTEEVLLWEDAKTIREEMAQADPNRSGIPVYFQIPPNCSPTDKANSIFWRLQVTADVPGIDYKTTFEVPIFQVAETAQGGLSAAEFAARFEAPESHPSHTTKAAGVKVEELAGYGTQFQFSRSRHLSMKLVPLIVFICGAIGVFFLWQSPFPWVFAIFLGLFDLLFFLAAFNAIFKSTQLLAHIDGLKVQTDWVFFQRNREIPASHIQSIEPHVGMKVGEKAYYDIRVRTASHSPSRVRTVTVASGISGRREAEWLIAKMSAALQLPDRQPTDIESHLGS